MPDLDSALYKWIRTANTRREHLDLPIGLIEDSIALLKTTFGPGYLEQLLIEDASPVAVLDDESKPLRAWLLSARSEQHIIQVLELAAYIRAFQEDSSLPSKVEKLKHDRLWPIFFELAIATRLKRACRAKQEVTLNPEANDSTGDFTISIAGIDIPCECSRLGNSPQVTEPKVLTESLFHSIEDKCRLISAPMCIKVRSTKPLTGHTYNCVLQLLRRAMRDARQGTLPAHYSDGHTNVWIEMLTSASEPVRPHNTDDWDAGMSLNLVPAKDHDEVATRFDQGERFREYEAMRLFLKFARTPAEIDHYSRLTAKLRKKLRQTKISDRHMGKIVFIEVPFSLREIDNDKLNLAVRAAAIHSKTTLSIILADREANPQTRYHYSQSATFNETALRTGKPEIFELVDFLNRAFQSELILDPILGLPYRTSWNEALAKQRHRERK